MGFDTIFGTMVTSAFDTARLLISDFTAPLAAVFAVGVVGLVFFAVRRFLQ